MTKDIVFIHGMFMTPKSWEKWVGYFTELGYNCVAVPWPLHNGEPAALRAHIPEGTGDIMLDDVLDATITAVGGYDKPIVIGHSVGGLLTQLLVARGLATAGVTISSVAPNAMLSIDWHFLKSTVPILNPIKGDDPQIMTPELFHETFANTLTEEQSRAEWEKYAVHESRNVLRSALGPTGHIDLDVPHVPLLFVTGEKDHIIPASLVEKNCLAYKHGRGLRTLEVFPDRGHHICNEPGWEQVPLFVHEWLVQPLEAEPAVPH